MNTKPIQIVSEEPDPATWERHIRRALADQPDARTFNVPRVFLERMLRDFDGSRDVARLLGGEEWTGGQAP